MKKICYLILLTILSLSLTGCRLKPDETKTTGEPETMVPEISKDNSLETIKNELDKTVINEFDQDLDSLDQDINQL